mmetsp:Transcript_26874/g.48860  ORF Transcript_26874/g.48860 Transcript_26874/m.48860 type:complete len:253 (-) Transcript_26874:548-1306(-)
MSTPPNHPNYSKIVMYLAAALVIDNMGLLHTILGSHLGIGLGSHNLFNDKGRLESVGAVLVLDHDVTVRRRLSLGVCSKDTITMLQQPFTSFNGVGDKIGRQRGPFGAEDCRLLRDNFLGQTKTSNVSSGRHCNAIWSLPCVNLLKHGCHLWRKVWGHVGRSGGTFSTNFSTRYSHETIPDTTSIFLLRQMLKLSRLRPHGGPILTAGKGRSGGRSATDPGMLCLRIGIFKLLINTAGSLNNKCFGYGLGNI